MDEPLDPLERDHSLSVVLPGGLEKNATVHGSQPVMDLLVTLCASHRLNPSDYTVEFLSPNKNSIRFKPNSAVGSLEAEKIVLKPKAAEETVRRPYMPEASVRLLVNYNKSHKAVVRVSPRVPLETLLPAVCDKCELKEETTVLLRDSRSQEVLDLTKTLNDHGLREIYAEDRAGVRPVDHQRRPDARQTAATPSDATPPPPPPDTPKKEKKPKRSAGFLGFFRRTKKKPDMAKSPEEAGSAPPSPGREKRVGLNGRDASPSAAPPAGGPKKRRAPQPPMGSSQSVPNNLGACHLRGSQRSEASTLRSTKRRAPPPPPCANTHQELQADTEVKGTVDSLTAVQEGRESDGSDSVNLSLSPSSSSPPSSSSSCRSPAPLYKTADPYLPSFRGKDFSDARSALAKVLTSSVSKGALVKRLRNSATFPKFSGSPSFTLATQRCSGVGIVCAEPEPLSKTSLPTEPEWEDPVQRKGTTTFKVVPSKKNQDPEVSLEVPDQATVEHNPEGEGSPELGENKAESEEDPHSESSDSAASLQPPLDLNTPVLPGSPLSEVGDAIRKGDASEVMPAAQSDCSEGELPREDGANSEGPAELSQSPSRRPACTDVDQCGSCIDEGPSEEGAAQAEEEEEEGGEDSDAFPPPPSPVFFNEDPEKMDEDGAASSEPTSERSAPKLQGIVRAAPSRFAQAVALAVQRSRLQNHGKGSGPEAPGGLQSTLLSPPRSMYQVPDRLPHTIYNGSPGLGREF